MNAGLKIHIRLFSLYRERAGASEVELEVPEGATLRTALNVLGQRLPALAPLVISLPADSVLLSVNRTYASLETRLAPGDEVAVFPPVSGG